MIERGTNSKRYRFRFNNRESEGIFRCRHHRPVIRLSSATTCSRLRSLRFRLLLRKIRLWTPSPFSRDRRLWQGPRFQQLT